MLATLSPPLPPTWPPLTLQGLDISRAPQTASQDWDAVVTCSAETRKHMIIAGGAWDNLADFCISGDPLAVSDVIEAIPLNRGRSGIRASPPLTMCIDQRLRPVHVARAGDSSLKMAKPRNCGPSSHPPIPTPFKQTTPARTCRRNRQPSETRHVLWKTTDPPRPCPLISLKSKSPFPADSGFRRSGLASSISPTYGHVSPLNDSGLSIPSLYQN